MDLRKTTKRIPVVVNFHEILAILARLEDRYRLIAEVQYGGELRLKERIRMRIKDIDIDRRQITIRQGKGDLDQVTVLPKALVAKLHEHKRKVREVYEADRRAGLPGVALPGALVWKFSKAGTRWEWMWVVDSHASSGVSRPAGCVKAVCLTATTAARLPAPEVSIDPESGTVRRRHVHTGCYAKALQRAVQEAGSRSA